MNTIAATTQRIPRPALIGLVGLVAAFAVLMVVRVGLGGSSSSSSTTAPAGHSSTSTKAYAFTTTPATRTQPKVTLLPGLPAGVAHALRYSKVTVVSVYVGQSATDRAMVATARKGARAAGAGFVAVNVGSDGEAAEAARFVGTVAPPATLVVRRPGTVVATFAGPVDSTVLQQAAHNAGARR